MTAGADVAEPFAALKIEKDPSKDASKRIATTTAKFQEKRRKEALQRQQQARLDRTHQARQVASREVAPPYEENSEEGTSDFGRGGQAEALTKEDTAFYAKQLMQPEWMIEVPARMPAEWYVMPRPEGARCLVIASWGGTVSRLRNGRILHRSSSWLPGGSRSTLSGTDAYCILDCIFHAADGTYYVMDLMCWKGYALYECSVEFRLFWRDTKFREELAEAAGESQCRYRFAPVPVYKCDADGLKAAHSDPLPFQRDGCYFLHKKGHYELEGPTPIALLWKDPECSRYFIDTDADGAVSHYQHVILQCGESRMACTGDDPPIPLGAVPDTVSVARPGRLLKFTIREGGIQIRDGEPVSADLHFEGLANQRRGRADPCSKIIFQHLARTSPIKLSHFNEAFQTEHHGPADGGSPGSSAPMLFGKC